MDNNLAVAAVLRSDGIKCGPTVDACIHAPVGSICVCVDVREDGKESIWRSMQAAVLSTLQTLLCCWRINAPTGLAQGDQRLMRQPSLKRTRQTHEY